jgi:predicted metal-dependent hydrolase
LKYLSHYPEGVQARIRELLVQDQLADYLLSKYPSVHDYPSDKALRGYVMDLKNQYLKKADPISKIIYDPKIHVVKNALGTHSYVSRVQGGKLKAKNEIRISTLFKKVPEDFLAMITVHELAHVREKEHNKAFYQLCKHMLPEYHQLEFDVRVYLTQVEELGEIY